MIFNKITPKLLRKVGRKTTFFMLQCVKNNCKDGNCMRATRRIYLERYDTKAFIRDKTRKLHFPVFDGCNHMQYQICRDVGEDAQGEQITGIAVCNLSHPRNIGCKNNTVS